MKRDGKAGLEELIDARLAGKAEPVSQFLN
jgi:hypothetical protein